jgi:hypothetical protein
MRYPEFHERLTANLAQHDLTVPGLLSLSAFQTLAPETQHAFVSSVQKTLHAHPDLLAWWVVNALSSEAGATPAKLLYLLTDVLWKHSDSEVTALVSAKDEMELAGTRAVEAAVADAKDVAQKAMEAAVAQAKAEARPLCVVCLISDADHMPFMCQHVSMCSGTFHSCREAKCAHYRMHSGDQRRSLSPLQQRRVSCVSPKNFRLDCAR